jgi:hypothetical protein
MTVPIIREHFSPEIKTFTKERFLEYLVSHKDELTKYSTFKLNKMFSINEYRITKLNKEITLTTDHYKPTKNDQPQSNSIENDQTRSNSINMVEALKILDEKITYVIEVMREHGWIECG